MAWTIAEQSSPNDTVPPRLALEPGPLAPLDAEQLAPPAAGQVFAALVAEQLAPADGLHQAIDSAHQTITEASDPAPFDAAASSAIGDTGQQLDAERQAADALDAGALVDASASKSTQAGGNVGDYNEPAPSEVTQTDAGPPPGSEGTGPPQI